MFILMNIIHTGYTQIFSATATQRKHRKHKIQKHAFKVITLALQQSALHTYFCLLKHHCALCFSAQRREVAGTHNYKNRDSLAFTYKVLTVQSVSENDRWQ